MVRERADEPTLRREEEDMLRTFVDTTNVRDSRWEPPLVDEDCRANCQAICKSVERAVWENLYTSKIGMHKAINFKKTGVNKKAKALWSIGEGKAIGEAYYDRSNERQIASRPQCDKRCGRRT